jgi:hypothetical protein
VAGQVLSELIFVMTNLSRATYGAVHVGDIAALRSLIVGVVAFEEAERHIVQSELRTSPSHITTILMIQALMMHDYYSG